MGQLGTPHTYLGWLDHSCAMLGSNPEAEVLLEGTKKAFHREEHKKQGTRRSHAAKHAFFEINTNLFSRELGMKPGF